MGIVADITAAEKPADTKEPETKPEAEAEEQFSEAEVKAMATRAGWTPKKYFKGDPANWLTAEQYMERAHTEMPIMRSALKKFERETVQLQALVRRLVDSNKQQQDRAVEQAIAKLKAERKEAAKEGDDAKVEAISDQIDKAKEAKPNGKTEEPAKVEIPEEFTEWVKDNQWFKTSKRMNKFAEGVWQELVESNDGGFNNETLGRQLALVTKEVKKEFPDKFGNPKRREPAAVEGSGNGIGRGGSGKTFDDLPADHKALCDDLVRQKYIKSRADYLRDYKW